MDPLEYCLIDKEIVLSESSVAFNLYIEKEDTKTITLLKEGNESFSPGDMCKINNGSSLYVKTEEILKYAHLYDLDTSDQNFSHSAKDLYLNASTILDNIFSTNTVTNEYQLATKMTKTIIKFISDKAFSLHNTMQYASKSYYTHTHSINVSIYALCLGKFLGMEHEELQDLGIAALLHDLGKRDIDNKLLYKEGSLTEDEFRIVKMHSVIGYNWARKLGIHNRRILDGIRYHHEKLDGSGYPYGLRGNDIPKSAKIIGICDIFDALTSKRSYQEKISSFEAFKLMKKKMNVHIDMHILDNMILLFQNDVKLSDSQNLHSNFS